MSGVGWGVSRLDVHRWPVLVFYESKDLEAFLDVVKDASDDLHANQETFQRRLLAFSRWVPSQGNVPARQDHRRPRMNSALAGRRVRAAIDVTFWMLILGAMILLWFRVTQLGLPETVYVPVDPNWLP